MLQFLVARAKEPSTYAGIAAILAAAGVPVSPDLFNAVVAAAVALAGVGAVLLPEKSGGKQ